MGRIHRGRLCSHGFAQTTDNACRIRLQRFAETASNALARFSATSHAGHASSEAQRPSSSPAGRYGETERKGLW